MRHVYLVSTMLTGCVFLYVLPACGQTFAVGVLAGGGFGILNTILLARLITASIRPGALDPLEVGIAFLVKIPIALGLLFLALSRGWIDPVGFLVGFPLVFVAMLACLIAHFYFGAGARTREGGEST